MFVQESVMSDLDIAYSLTKDIIVVILLPLLVFIGSVLVIFLIAQKYITYSFQSSLCRMVSYSSDREAQIRLQFYNRYSEKLPAYEDVMQPSQGTLCSTDIKHKTLEPPPPYNYSLCQQNIMQEALSG
ncbi:hypothetical protein Btru_061879 [Bulinus truncatus]|nr:hypothetical protein Btru_061879 [Bulinus truncatus]